MAFTSERIGIVGELMAITSEGINIIGEEIHLNGDDCPEIKNAGGSPA